MKKFYLALKAQLEAKVPELEFIHKWNNQHQLLMDEKGAKIYLFGMPAAFIAFKTSTIMQLGGGLQIYDPLIFEIHILDWIIDAGDGTFEQNLQIYDLKDKIFKALQKFQPGLVDESNPVGSCIRIGEEEDDNHAGVYHYIQRYQTTYIEKLMEEPVNGIDGPVPPLPLALDVTYQQTVDKSEPYNPLIQYLAVDGKYVENAGKYYQIGIDTPNPAGAFDAAYWTQITLSQTLTPEP